MIPICAAVLWIIRQDCCSSLRYVQPIRRYPENKSPVVPRRPSVVIITHHEDTPMTPVYAQLAVDD